MRDARRKQTRDAALDPASLYLDALGAERIPDPTTAGDFCRPL
jgi:hypothetical protein